MLYIYNKRTILLLVSIFDKIQLIQEKNNKLLNNNNYYVLIIHLHIYSNFLTQVYFIQYIT